MTTFNENSQDLLAAVQAFIQESAAPKQELANDNPELGQLSPQALQNALEASESLSR
tara:strand:- start:5 stop:175 length:171 start_codon:yes stop_codon:yes gene_type:complete